MGDGIGSKFGRILCSLVGFFAGYIIGFIYCWQLALVMLAQLPLLFVVGGLMATVSSLNVKPTQTGRDSATRRDFSVFRNIYNCF